MFLEILCDRLLYRRPEVAVPRQTVVESVSVPVTPPKSKKRKATEPRVVTRSGKSAAAVDDATGGEASEVSEMSLASVMSERLTKLADTADLADFVKKNMPLWLEEEMKASQKSGRAVPREVQDALDFWVKHGCGDTSDITSKFDTVMYDAFGNFIINDHVVAVVAYVKKTAIFVYDWTQHTSLRIAAYVTFMQPCQAGGFTHCLTIQNLSSGV